MTKETPDKPAAARGKAGAQAAASEGSAVAEFEKSLDELEALVARMEQGEMSLDDSLKSFERGIALYRACQGTLEQAELKVRQLCDPADPDAAEPFGEA